MKVDAAERIDLITEVYRAFYNTELESGEVPELIYLFGAIATGGDMGVPPGSKVESFLSENFPSGHKVWSYVI